MERKGVTPIPNTNNDAVIGAVAACIAPTVEEVADWHFVDQVLASEWDRPLVRLLRFFVEPSPLAAEAQIQLSHDDEVYELDPDVVVDLVASEILDLTNSLHIGEELAS